MAFVDVVMLLMVIICLFFGFFKGVVKISLAIITFYLSIVIASLYFHFVAVAIAKNSKTSLQVLDMLSFLILLIVCFMILLWAALYTFRYVQIGGRVQYLDKMIGSFLGLLLGAIMASVFAMMLRYLFITVNSPATLDFPAMRFLQQSTANSVLKNVFLDIILPILYAPISPIMPDSADLIFRRLQ